MRARAPFTLLLLSTGLLSVVPPTVATHHWLEPIVPCVDEHPYSPRPSVGELNESNPEDWYGPATAELGLVLYDLEVHDGSAFVMYVQEPGTRLCHNWLGNTGGAGQGVGLLPSAGTTIYYRFIFNGPPYHLPEEPVVYAAEVVFL